MPKIDKSAAPILSRTALNRALLARQMLLAREKTTVVKAVERLVGMQAQQARPPFVGLWSRIEGFKREDLLKAIHSRKVVRATLMRATLHLMSAKDYVEFRPVLQPMLNGANVAALRERAKGLDADAITASARDVFSQQHRTFAQLRSALATSFPDCDERAMGYTVRTRLPLVTVPDDVVWGFRPDSSFALAESWIGKPLRADQASEDFALRFLAAYGPATASDVQAWSGLAGMQAVLDALRPKLVVFRDERKRELFDVPDGLRPDEETPSPPRVIAAFDNLILAHSDRSRIVPEEHRPRVVTKNLQVLPTFLVDGFVAGTWKSEVAKNAATLTISPFGSLAKTVKAQLTDEAEKLIRFMEPDAGKFAVAYSH